MSAKSMTTIFEIDTKYLATVTSIFSIEDFPSQVVTSANNGPPPPGATTTANSQTAASCQQPGVIVKCCGRGELKKAVFLGRNWS